MSEPRTSRKRKTVNYTESLELEDPTTAKGKSKRKGKFAEDEDSDDFMEELPKNRKSSQEGSSQECKGGRKSKSSAENKPTKGRTALSLAERREKAELQKAIELSKKSTKRTDIAEEGGNVPTLGGGLLPGSEPSPKPQQTQHLTTTNHDTKVEIEINETSNEVTELNAIETPTNPPSVEEHTAIIAAETGPDDSGPNTDKNKENCAPKSAVKKPAKQQDDTDDGSTYDEDPEEEDHAEGDETSSDESAFEPEEDFQPPAESKAKMMVKDVIVKEKPKPKSIPPKKKLVKEPIKTAPRTKPVIKPSKSVPPPRVAAVARLSDTGLGGLGMLKGSATYRVGLSKRHKSAAPLHPYLKLGSSPETGTSATKGTKKL